ncbi:MAG: alpha/beta fold hydrolase [Janthinobacterium lividum]
MKISSNGVDLNVTDTGAQQPEDIALVFLHHWGGSSQTWNEVISRLRARFRCIAIDARGAGASDAPAKGYSTTDHARDALIVVASLGLARYILVGHSMGGKAAQLMAAGRPQGLLGVVLVASSPLSPMAIDETQREQMKSAYADRNAIEWSLENVLSGSPIAESSRAQLLVDALRLSPQAKTGWIDIGTREDFSQRAADIEVPIVIVAGELDRVDPIAVVNAHIVARYPSAPVHFLPNKGHLLPVEAPEDVAAIIGVFAASLQAE